MKALRTLTLSLVVLSAASIELIADSEPALVTPISWIKDTQHDINVDDKEVTIVGQVIRKDGGSDWWFADHTGAVRLDTDEMELPVGPTLIIHGNIDQARFGVGYLEVEVKRWDYVQKPASLSGS